MNKTVYLLGAGISVEAPASMPAALGLVKQIVQQITPHAAVRRKLLSLFDPARPDAAHRSDFLRFETFMEVLKEHADPELTVLDFLRELHHPNALHLTLAREAIRGATLITTNFDSFLEDAIRLLGHEPCTICEEKEFKDWRKHVPAGHVPVFKIHGSVERWRGSRSRSAKRSVIATIASLTHSGVGMRLPKHKEAFLHETLDGARLIVAGYSAADELDVVPSLTVSHPAAVTWLEFDPHQAKPKDETAATMRAVSATDAGERSGKEQLFAAWHLILGRRFRHLRVHTGNYLAAIHGIPRAPLHPEPDMATEVVLARHLWSWKRLLQHPADRANIIGEIFFRLGHYRSTAKWFKRGLKQARGDAQREPMLTLFLARVSMERAKHAEAMRLLKSLPLAVIRKQPLGRQARYWHHLGVAHYKLRRFRHALSCYARALQIAEALDDKGMQATIVHDEGIIWQERGCYDRAAQCFADSIPLSRMAGDARHIAWSQFHLATVSFMNADFAQARSAMESALAQAKVLNDLSHVSNCGHGLALIEFQEGRLAEAARRTRSCIHLGSAVGQREWTGMDWEHLAVCFWEAGRIERAEKCFKVAERALKAVHDDDTLSEVYAYWSEMLQGLGREKEARAKASWSLSLAEKSKLPEFLSRSLFIFGVTEYLEGKQATGRRLMKRGLRLGAKTPVIALDLVFSASRLGLAHRNQGLLTLPLLQWARGIYEALSNGARLQVLSRSVQAWGNETQ